MEYQHINECWEAIRRAKTIDEVEKLFDQFPRWSGEWYVEVDFDGADGKYVVYNDYWDKDAESLDTECEELDIPVANDDLPNY